MTGTSVGTGWDVAMGEAMWVLMLGSPCCGVGRNVSSCPTAGVPRGSHPPCPILGSKWKLISSVGAHALGLGGEGFLHSTEGALGFPLCFVASFPGLKCLAEAKQGGSGPRASPCLHLGEQEEQLWGYLSLLAGWGQWVCGMLATTVSKTKAIAWDSLVEQSSGSLQSWLQRQEEWCCDCAGEHCSVPRGADRQRTFSLFFLLIFRHAKVIFLFYYRCSKGHWVDFTG